jgi:cysteine desulfurase/selenocysteine lyase
MSRPALGVTALDPEAVRGDFPLLADGAHGRPPVVYLDSAATSQTPEPVLAAMDAYYREARANVHRGVYRLSVDATDRYEGARGTVARFVGAAPADVVFTRNATEAINLVAWAWGMRELGPGDEIVLTEMEHHSNMVPWQLVATATGATVRYAPVTDEGEIDRDALSALMGPRTRMLAVVHVSNALGTVNPVAELAEEAHRHGALCLVDGAQSVPHMPVDLAELGCDLLAFTGHKMLGPTGIGVLAARPGLLETIEPFMGGGEMIADVTTDGSTWREPPWRFEAGTPAIAEAIGLGAAVEYLEAIGMAEVRAHERRLTASLLDALAAVPGLRVLGPLDADRRGGAVSFVLDDVHPHDLAHLLDAHGICVRAGHHCTRPLMRRFGVPATARASMGIYNRDQDVAALVAGIEATRAYFDGRG